MSSQDGQLENNVLDADEELPISNPLGGRKPANLGQLQRQNPAESDGAPADPGVGGNGGRIGPVRESRIKDRPAKGDGDKSSLKINIELDLEVEVDLYARVKGDVTIGLL